MSNPNAPARRDTNQNLMRSIMFWDECVQGADRRYYDPVCQLPSDRAHALSKAWLNTLAEKGKVYWFAHGAGLFPELRKPLLARETPPVLDRVQREAHPGLTPIDVATTGRFCCGEHDLKFHPIDSLETLNPRDPDDYHLKLMFLQALLSQLHNDTAFDAWRRRNPEWGPLWNAFPNLDRNNVAHLQPPREILLEALGSKGGSWRVQHIKWHLPGSPRVAACVAGSWRPVDRRLAPADRECTGAWGLTVVPHAEGHLVVYHYCTTLPKRHRSRTRRSLMQMDQYLRAEAFGDGADPARRISRDILTQCMNVCLAPAVWDVWTECRRDAVRDVFFSTKTVIGPQTADCPDVNLFD